jgi:primary-amine oxidase
MPILESDYAAVDEITKADPDWRAAMARRGYHDVATIRTAPITAGNYGPPDDDRRRMVRVLAFVQDSEHDLAWAHPIDGVAAYVDLIENRVFKVTDEFELPVPKFLWKHTDIFNGSAQSRRQPASPPTTCGSPGTTRTSAGRPATS